MHIDLCSFRLCRAHGFPFSLCFSDPHQGQQLLYHTMKEQAREDEFDSEVYVRTNLDVRRNTSGSARLSSVIKSKRFCKCIFLLSKEIEIGSEQSDGFLLLLPAREPLTNMPGRVSDLIYTNTGDVTLASEPIS